VEAVRSRRRNRREKKGRDGGIGGLVAPPAAGAEDGGRGAWV
jgi:hypothetical protein